MYPPVYAKTIDLKDATIGIPEGYSEMKDASPTQYVTKNNATGGKIAILNSSGTAEDEVNSIMSGLNPKIQEYDINGIHWIGGISDGFYCFATTIGGSNISISIDFGGTMEEMEKLIAGVKIK